MKSYLEEQVKHNVKLKIELDEIEWKECIQQTANKLSQNITTPGFRPGKAPLESVMNQIGETRLVSEAAELAINKFYPLALKEQQVFPISPPKISVEKVALKEPLIFKAEIITMPEVELGDYNTIKVETKTVEVDTDKIEGILKNIQRQQAKFNPVEREIQKGDWVEIDFDGKIDGKTFEGGSSKNHPMIVGDGVFLPEFETALIGMKAGEEKTFPVTFPADYHKQEFASKKAEFTVKLHKIKAVVLPEINDELAKMAGNFKDLTVLKDDIAKFLKEDMDKKELDSQKEEAINQLIKLTKVDLPDELVEQEIDSMLHDLKHQLEHQKMELEEYLQKMNITEKKLREDWKETATKRVIAGLALNAFRAKENIEASDKDIGAEIERLKNTYPEEKDEISEKYEKNWERERLKILISGQMAIDKLWQIATGK